MAIQRLDLRSVRYDRFNRSVLFDARNGCTVEISQEALEAQFNCDLAPEEAIAGAVEIVTQLTTLATRLPPDDGRIHITRSILMGDGLYAETLPAREVEEREVEEEE